MRDLGYIASDRTEIAIQKAPSQFHFKHPVTEAGSVDRNFGNDSDHSNRDVSIYSDFLDIWLVKVRKLFNKGLHDLIYRELRRSKSERPINRVMKMSLKHVYPNKKLCKINHMHASVDHNLPKQVRKDISDFEARAFKKGFEVKRIPSIDINPVDHQYQRMLLTNQNKAI